MMYLSNGRSKKYEKFITNESLKCRSSWQNDFMNIQQKALFYNWRTANFTKVSKTPDDF